LGEKDSPSWFIFLSLSFGQIIGCSLLHEILFFFHFFFTFEINSLVWSIYWKKKLFLLKHYLNNMYEISDGLEGVGWDDKDRLGSWPSLIWSQGTKYVWTCPSYWWHEENDMDFKSWPNLRVWIGFRVQNVFDFPIYWWKG